MDIKVLCLDDEASIRMSLERSLRRAFSVRVTATYKEAKEAIKNFEPNVFLCDRFVEQGDLQEFMQEVYDLDPNLSVIVITGDRDSKELSELKSLPNFTGLVQKPVKVSAIKEMIIERVRKS